MDIKDFRKLVETSVFKSELNAFEVTIDYVHLNTAIELKGIQSVYKFIFDQVIGWNKLENIAPEFLASKIHFENLKSSLVALATFTTTNLQSRFNVDLANFKSRLIKIKSNSNDFIFIDNAPETQFLLSINKKSRENFLGAYSFLTNSNISQTRDSNFFTGFLLAYEFKQQGQSEITSRRTSEKLSLSQIKTKYYDYIVEAEQLLNSNISDAKENLTNHFETVDTLKEEKNKNFEDWFTSVQEGFDSFFKNSNNSIKNNENLYREKLRLEAPAKYWKDRADKLRAESDYQMDMLIRISLFGSTILFIILLAIGNNYYLNIFNDTVKGIKWSLILITIISLLVFIIRILSKLYMSSLHLSRDAEEREQLTHFYLALKKDTTIEPEERQLILQSLFSRADTGLLKDDSSPTMPTSIIEKFTGGR